MPLTKNIPRISSNCDPTNCLEKRRHNKSSSKITYHSGQLPSSMMASESRNSHHHSGWITAKIARPGFRSF
ncbi:hypothetical protein ACS0PU_002407 [Formica fusca]